MINSSKTLNDSAILWVSSSIIVLPPPVGLMSCKLFRPFLRIQSWQVGSRMSTTLTNTTLSSRNKGLHGGVNSQRYVRCSFQTWLMNRRITGWSTSLSKTRLPPISTSKVSGPKIPWRYVTRVWDKANDKFIQDVLYPGKIVSHSRPRDEGGRIRGIVMARYVHPSYLLSLVSSWQVGFKVDLKLMKSLKGLVPLPMTSRTNE